MITVKTPLKLPPGFIVEEPPPPPPAGKKKKRGRPRKAGRPRGYRNVAPSKRDGKRYFSVTVGELTYTHLKELRAFYKYTSIGQVLDRLVKPAFEKAYQDALTIMKADQRKEREREVATRNAARAASDAHL